MIEDIIPAQCHVSVPEERYQEIDAYIESAEAFSRNMFRPILIVDLNKKDLLYVSNNFSYLFADENLHAVTTGQRTLPDFVRDAVLQLKVIFGKAYDRFMEYPLQDRKNLVFSFYFSHLQNEKKKMVYQSMTPLALTPEGQPWLLLCTTTYSSRKQPGHYTIKLHNDREFLQYVPEKDIWYHKESPVLTDQEKEILLLSLQGYTMKEIAGIFNKTEDSIKLYKRILFNKLGVRSITEATLTAINLNLV